MILNRNFITFDLSVGVVIVEDPMSVNVTAPNDTLTLNCTAVNNPNAPNNLTFLWIFDSSFLMNPTTREIVVNKTTVTSQLIIEGVDRSNDGSYICQVHNRVQNMDSVDSEPANVTVFCKSLNRMSLFYVSLFIALF